MLSRYIAYATRIATVVLTRTTFGRRLLLRRVLSENARHAHPFDVAYGIRTSGFVPNFLSDPGLSLTKILTRENNHYAGCYPNSVRQAIRSIPETGGHTFYDLGCGMGRALVTASEFPFREPVGIDLSDELCAIARTNAGRIAERFPDRARIRIHQGDATALPLKADRIVVFMYHPFGRATLTAILRTLAEAATSGGDVVLILANPVNGDLVDALPEFGRWYAEQVACEPDALDHHSDPHDGVVVWRSIAGMAGRTAPRSDFEIVVTKPGWRAEVLG